MEKVICFSLGLSREDIEKGRVSFCDAYQEKIELEVIPLTEDMMPLRVGDILERATAGGPWQDDVKEKQVTSSVQVKYRVVMVNTMEREQVLRVMRSFKAVLPNPQDMIFAVITDTALTWTFGEYTGHLAGEHEYMKARKSET
ncbi:MAG: DUF3783 domain-containing protein [Smithellaceae bacterium]|nr:DUF3783 domain-containing protein [Smithellaceae bacterium]